MGTSYSHALKISLVSLRMPIPVLLSLLSAYVFFTLALLGFRQFPSFKKYTSQYSSKSMIPLVYFPLLRSLLRTSQLHFIFPDGEEMERLNRYFGISSKLFSSLYILKIVFTTSACSGTISTNPYLSLLKP